MPHNSAIDAALARVADPTEAEEVNPPPSPRIPPRFAYVMTRPENERLIKAARAVVMDAPPYTPTGYAAVKAQLIEDLRDVLNSLKVDL